MTGRPLPFGSPKPPRRGAKPRPGTYVDNKRHPAYTQDRLRWPSSLLGTYRHGDQVGDTETEET